jgi:hypothetical protein
MFVSSEVPREILQPDVAGVARPLRPATASTATAHPPGTATVTARAAAADVAALGVRAALDRLSLALARAAVAFLALRAWSVFGYARLEDLARERYGRSGRWLRDLAALGEGVAAAPPLAEALTGADGGRPLGRVAATLIARAAAAAVRPPPGAPFDDWIVAARRLGVRELRAAIREARAIHERSPEGAPEAEPPPDPPDPPDPVDPDDPDADRVLVRLPVPAAVLAAFEETLELHRAVQGRGASVGDFIAALVGEAQSDGLEVDAGLVGPLEHGTPEAEVEAALRQASGAWSELPEPSRVAADGPVLARFIAAETEAGYGDAVALDEQLRALVRLEDELEAELGRVLAEMAEGRDLVRLRFASVGHYAEERIGMSRSRAGERARLARALRSLPRVATACAAGRISMEAAAIIHRILSGADVCAADRDRPDAWHGCDRDTLEAAWVEHAASTTIKRMRDEARALGRYRVRAWLRGRPPVAGPRTEPGPLKDAEWHASIRREAGTATRRLAAMGLAALGVGHVSLPSSEPDVFQRLLPEPDVCVRLRLPVELAQDFLAAIEAERVALEARAGAVAWDAAWPPAGCAERPSAWAARLAFVRARRAPLWAGLLALLEDYAATWDTDGAAPARRDDSVLIRDGWRCTAPGCSSRANLEVHHVLYRSRGGSDAGWNRVTLCRFHHQCGEHGGLLCVRGRAPLGLTWRLGRPDVAGTWRAERRVKDGASVM